MAISKNAITWMGTFDEPTKNHITQALMEDEMEKGFAKFTRYIDDPAAYIELHGRLAYLWKLISPMGRRDTYYYCAEHRTAFKGNLRNLLKVVNRHRGKIL
jgi:hypothetical protein